MKCPAAAGRMIRQIARPHLQHAEEAELAADEFRITRQLLQSGGRGLEEEAVDERLVAVPQGGIERVRQGEGEHEVRYRQQYRALHREPFVGFVIATFWAMPILAGMITEAIFLARLAEKDFAAKFFRATSDDLLHNRPMA